MNITQTRFVAGKKGVDGRNCRDADCASFKVSMQWCRKDQAKRLGGRKSADGTSLP